MWPFQSSAHLRVKLSQTFSLLTLTSSLLLASCGGGGSSAGDQSASSSSIAAQTGTVNLALTDGPSDDFTHVWITVKAISFHTDPDQNWAPGDATWQTTTLPAPLTFDLAALNNGKLNNLFQGINLPVGTYKQIRLFFVAADEDLTTSAQSNTPALQWNDQVEYVDRKGNTQEAPLEIAYPTQGMQLNGTFKVDANSQLNLAVDVDLEESVVPFKHDGAVAFTLKPTLRYFDLNQAGSIAGKIDTTQLCASISSTNCAYNLIVKAELPGADRHFVARATSLKADGSFALFPLPVKDINGNALTYDVIIRGRNMETLLVKAVPVTLGSTADLTPTQIQTAPISLTINTQEYTAQFDSALQPLTSGWSIFQQTLTNASSPNENKAYEIRWANTDPFTGELLTPIALARGPLHVATYNGGNTLNFANQSPTETGGDGSYSVATNNNVYSTLSSNTVIQAPVGSNIPSTNNLLSFTPPSPSLDANVSAGIISGNIAIANNSRGYDSAQLVLVRFANIITTVDVSAQLANGGSYQITQVPAGSSAHAIKGAYYYAYLRVWKANSLVRPKIVPINSMIDLRTTNSASGVNVTINL